MARPDEQLVVQGNAAGVVQHGTTGAAESHVEW